MAAVVLACTAPPTLEARLAIPPTREPPYWEPKFTECEGCPVVENQLPSGKVEQITVAPGALYTLQVSEINSIEILEVRSPELIGVRSYVVVAQPSEPWFARTEEARERFPYDKVGWFVDDRLLVVTHNISSRVQGALWIGVFACEDDAVALVEKLRKEATVTRQSDGEYEEEVRKTNARYTKALEEIRRDPQLASEYLSEDQLQSLLEDGMPEFPIPPKDYYGQEHEVPDCGHEQRQQAPGSFRRP